MKFDRIRSSCVVKISYAASRIFLCDTGSSVSEATLLAIGGEAINVFDIDSFDELGRELHHDDNHSVCVSHFALHIHHTRGYRNVRYQMFQWRCSCSIRLFGG